MIIHVIIFCQYVNTLDSIVKVIFDRS